MQNPYQKLLYFLLTQTVLAKKLVEKK